MALTSLTSSHPVYAAGIDDEICNVGADFALGAEDYAEAIRLHREVVRTNPQNALAHYHLGYAEGMIGHRDQELEEYRRAQALGLETWDLYLNQGLALLDRDELAAATTSLKTSVLLGEEHAETHFNLALAEEQQGRLADAEQETKAALRFNADQPDARNLLGVIYAEEGNLAQASRTWHELIAQAPDYEPALTNLRILEGEPSEARTVELTRKRVEPAEKPVGARIALTAR